MSIEQLKKYSEMVNIAEDLDSEKLLEIGKKVLAGYEDDLSSQQEWINDVERVIELSTLKSTKKTTPLPNSANVKMPIITKACNEFHSRAYPEIIRDGKIVKARVLGHDINGQKQAQADRVAEYMNYQLLFEQMDWEMELDRLLFLLPLIGFICKKTYYDPIRKMIKSEMCDWKDLVIGADVKNLSDARRVSHVIHQNLNDLIAAAKSDVFLTDPVEELIDLHAMDVVSKPIDLIEQHCFLDLDDDDYEEPYIVTVLKADGKILRISPRFTTKSLEEDVGEGNKIKFITALQLFTDYHFLVSPKGKFHSVGFGILMLHLNETINSVTNQLLDSAQIANMQGGLIDSAFKPLKSGDLISSAGQFTKIKVDATGKSLKDGTMLFNFKEPSSVMFQLLGMLIQTARDLSSSTEVMTGQQAPDNAKTGAVTALIAEGKKLVTSIQRRVYRSLTQEMRKIFILDGIYLDPTTYALLIDDDIQVLQADFDPKTINILPVADPNLSSDVQRSTKIQTLLAARELVGVDPLKISQRILHTAEIDNPEGLMLDEKQMGQPNPDVIKIQADIANMAEVNKLRGHELQIKEKQMMLDAHKLECELVKMKTESIKNLAQAEAAEAGTQLQDYKLQMDILSEKINHLMTDRQRNDDMTMHENEMAMRQQEVDNASATDPGVAPESGDTSTDVPPTV